MATEVDARSLRRPHAAVAVVLLAALAYTLLNALKPLHVDDPFTWYVSQQILRAPLDPYGFEIFWYQWPQPCSEDLLAPVVGYWGALGLLFAGANDFLWKLSLLPLAALFAVSFHRLAGRFAPGLETPLTLMTLFSPAFLPSLNYMQDVPALAFGLAALALYLRAEERGALGPALLAGALAGVAMQTKYTAFSIPAAMGLHALLFGRIRLGIAAGLVALGVFAAWEAFVTLQYGQGMFVGQIRFSLFRSPRADIALMLFPLLGAPLGVVSLLGLAALGVPARIRLALAAGFAAGHALLFVGPFERGLFSASGAVAAVALAATSAALLRRSGSGTPLREHLQRRRTELFLVLWLLLEIAAYAQISLFPATRRVLPLAIVGTLLFGRAAALATPRRRLALAPLVALQAVLGLLYFGADLAEARAQRDAARGAMTAIRARDPSGDVWFVGHWGFQHYAEALGMRPLIPDYSELAAGDWVVMPTRVDQQVVALDPGSFEQVAAQAHAKLPPLFTSFGFYSGFTPLEHARGPHVTARIFRAREAVIPPSGWTLKQVAEWAMQAGGRQAGWARRALERHLAEHRTPEGRRLAARALGALGPLAADVAPALARAAESDPDPDVRGAAAEALLRIAPP